MRPESMDAVFHALAHRDRRQILDLVREAPGCTVGEVCEPFETSRIAVLKHLAVLEDAGLILREREGRTKRLYLNAVPIRMILDRWLTEYTNAWAGHMTAIKYRVEAEQDPRQQTKSRQTKPRKRRTKKAARRGPNQNPGE